MADARKTVRDSSSRGQGRTRSDGGRRTTFVASVREAVARVRSARRVGTRSRADLAPTDAATAVRNKEVEVSRSGGRSGADREGSPMRGDGSFSRYVGVRGVLNPLWCYHGFRLAVLMLTGFGVVMVFSSSTVTMIAAGVSPWRQAVSQGVYCVLGVVVGLVATRLSVRFYQRVSGAFLILSILLQLLTLTPLGVEVNGNTGWIGIAGVFTMQPAEVMKLSLCLWLPLAMRTAGRRFASKGISAYGVPSAIFVVCLGAVMLGKDLGTAMIVVFIGAVAFVIGGFPFRWLLAVAGSLVALIAVFVVRSPNRMNRIFAAYGRCTGEDALNVCYQSMRAKYAMGSGGLWGVGLGNSREKWHYLPEAHNDFIFAVIGEEVGFIGAALVILLFVVLGWCLMGVALQSRDRYVSMVLVCVAAWLVGQGLVNVMVVVGLLPVMGVPMPFVSAGGSSLIMCLTAAGVAVGMMRSHPQIRADATALHS